MQQYKNIYFIGIGGIGMSALARYFLEQNKTVAGYDKTQSEITKALQKQGIAINYTDDAAQIPNNFDNPAQTLIVYTPAIPKDNLQLRYFVKNGFAVKKRAEVLGKIAANYKCIAVSGTHGKTTTTALLIHMFCKAKVPFIGFLGGLSVPDNTNYFSSGTNAEWLITEADEFDRSFLHLHPHTLVITSIDADHLDVYKDVNAFVASFCQLAANCTLNATVIFHKSVSKHVKAHAKTLTYAHQNADYTFSEIQYTDAGTKFTIQTPSSSYTAKLPLPGNYNIENALAAVAAAEQSVPNVNFAQHLSTFPGIKRRFQKVLQTKNTVFYDDYAHHPAEIDNFRQGLQQLFPKANITCIFQPHLYSRTRDFLEKFAEALSQFYHVILLPVYPARETPECGVESTALLEKINSPSKVVVPYKELVKHVEQHAKNWPILTTIGAGDIDKLVQPIAETLKKLDK